MAHAEAAEKAAIELSLTQIKATCVISESQTQICNFASGRISQEAFRILQQHPIHPREVDFHSRRHLLWIPADTGVTGLRNPTKRLTALLGASLSEHRRRTTSPAGNCKLLGVGSSLHSRWMTALLSSNLTAQLWAVQIAEEAASRQGLRTASASARAHVEDRAALAKETRYGRREEKGTMEDQIRRNCPAYMGRGFFYFSEESLGLLVMSWVARKDFDAIIHREMKYRVRWLVDTGMVQLFMRDVSPGPTACWLQERHKSDMDGRMLQFDDLESIFVLYTLLLQLAVAAFIIECLGPAMSRCNGRLCHKRRHF
ncbi:hypothetical protein HPB51_012936 [Rhipicephalus microplus]|uniref:Uncharacterized protein n=1 Tax=Rhipicephalus microplus TaxID=6941 RepID=A0A9J6F1R0_RHIMP|nr:hypothetical protein HPB51_012936 [Rhipicephalus microplus]